MFCLMRCSTTFPVSFALSLSSVMSWACEFELSTITTTLCDFCIFCVFCLLITLRCGLGLNLFQLLSSFALHLPSSVSAKTNFHSTHQQKKYCSPKFSSTFCTYQAKECTSSKELHALALAGGREYWDALALFILFRNSWYPTLLVQYLSF